MLNDAVCVFLFGTVIHQGLHMIQIKRKPLLTRF